MTTSLHGITDYLTFTGRQYNGCDVNINSIYIWFKQFISILFSEIKTVYNGKCKNGSEPSGKQCWCGWNGQWLLVHVNILCIPQWQDCVAFYINNWKNQQIKYE